MDSHVLNWVCIVAVLLMPGVFNFLIVTYTRGGLRAIVLLAVFALPLGAVYLDQQCHAFGDGDACFAHDLLAWAGFMLGVSALFGTAAGVISHVHRHHQASFADSLSR
jgi:hypothetical protein